MVISSHTTDIQLALSFPPLRHASFSLHLDMSGGHLTKHGSSSTKTNSLKNSMIMTSNNRQKFVVLANQLLFSAHAANLIWSCRFLFYNKRTIRPFLPIMVTFAVPCLPEFGLLPLAPGKSSPVCHPTTHFQPPQVTPHHSIAALHPLAPCSCQHQT